MPLTKASIPLYSDYHAKASNRPLSFISSSLILLLPLTYDAITATVLRVICFPNAAIYRRLRLQKQGLSVGILRRTWYFVKKRSLYTRNRIQDIDEVCAYSSGIILMYLVGISLRSSSSEARPLSLAVIVIRGPPGDSIWSIKNSSLKMAEEAYRNRQ